MNSPLLVKNMGDSKEPWGDIPFEIIIEEERRRQVEEDLRRPRIELPIYEPHITGSEQPTNSEMEYEEDASSDDEQKWKVVIKLL
jgi:hypothetical protein